MQKYCFSFCSPLQFSTKLWRGTTLEITFPYSFYRLFAVPGPESSNRGGAGVGGHADGNGGTSSSLLSIFNNFTSFIAFVVFSCCLLVIRYVNQRSPGLF